MAGKESVAWKRAGVETTAIVMSILLAFAIDAWWENPQEGMFAQEMLLVPSSARTLAGDNAIMQRLFSSAEFRSVLEARFAFLSHAVDDVIAATDSILEKNSASLEDGT